MADPKRLFHPSEVPQKPGVYIYRDRFGKVIYVGKAANLRKRVSSYFQPGRQLRADAKTRSLINSIASWEFQVVNNEEESLILESRLIKEYAPYYNILMRDDKRYLLLKINLHEKFPTLALARVKKQDGATYFGPFPHGYALKSTMEFLLAYFQLRGCKDPDPSPDTRKRCLKRVVKDCSGPCIGGISQQEYRKLVDKMLKVLDGDVAPLRLKLTEQMTEYAKANRFEAAAKLRDVMNNLDTVFGKKVRSFERVGLASPSGVQAARALQKVLGLPHMLYRIEGMDISNILGELAVGSLVVFVNGSPSRRDYRRFRIKTVHQSDDFAMMKEVIVRHFTRKIDENLSMPDLLMVDGGKGQLSAAVEALIQLNLSAFPVIGLAKRNEEIWLPGAENPIVLDRTDPALRLLQALRDEAHRFAISYHRKLRSDALQNSILDDIPSIGSVRKKALLRAFGSLRELRKASVEEIKEKVPGFGDSFARKIVDFLTPKK